MQKRLVLATFAASLCATAARPAQISMYAPVPNPKSHECQFHETMATAHAYLNHAWDEYLSTLRMKMLGCFPTEEAKIPQDTIIR